MQLSVIHEKVPHINPKGVAPRDFVTVSDETASRPSGYCCGS